MPGRLSLRARLLLAVVALAATGLVAADVVTYTSLRSFLLDRVDGSLEASAHALRVPFDDPHVTTPGLAVQVRSLDGTKVLATVPGRGGPGQEAARPTLPQTLTPPTEVDGRDRVRYLTVPGADGGRYRVRASIEPGAEAMLVVSTSLADVDSTLGRLLLIELVVTIAVLAALTALALWLVRLGLRPLDAIGETAAAIAAGDLSQRVARAEERTEVGRLGLALNGMLSQIESAFRAREASERKLRQFVADASHELRTPLAAVRAYAELFSRGAAERPDDLARSMSGITRESERMSLLVDDLLLLARLDEGRPLEREPVRLDELVTEAVETARAVAPERALDLDVQPVTVLGDRERLRQIVDNLLANVRTHTPVGTAARVEVTRTAELAEITVTDEGPGLDEDQLAHVFERFYRADPSRARASGGVGLGLSIVSAVATAHGGSVAAAAAGPTGGARFTITLPATDDTTAPTAH